MTAPTVRPVITASPMPISMCTPIIATATVPSGAPPVSTGAGAQTHQPDDLEALLVTARFDGGKLVEARLHPADLGLDHRPTSKAGNPTTPSPELARQILEKVQRISKPFGTTIAIENGVGIIRASAASTR